MGGFRSALDPETHFEIVRSETPITEDGYKIGEPKLLECEECGASVLLTEDPSPGIDELGHEPDCPQRYARTATWRDAFLGDSMDAPVGDGPNPQGVPGQIESAGD